MKKLVSSVLCMMMVFTLTVPAFADSPTIEAPSVEAVASVASVITMKHTDVVVRSAPGTSNSKIGTLYVGDTVTVNNWYYQKVGSYWWVQIIWGDGYGYVRSDLIP